VPILGGLHWTGGCRLGAIAETLGASRAALRQAARHLIDSGLIMEHPARAGAFELSRTGRRIAPACHALYMSLYFRRLDGVGLKKWPLAVLAALGSGGRFSEIRALLPAITDRGLALALKDLEANRLVTRRIVEGRPPATVYTPADNARKLLERLDDLEDALTGTSTARLREC
jgi:DNA-binding HxlR family transcriptional regulator